eukprot:2621840-Amphidinium_carterae.1
MSFLGYFDLEDVFTEDASTGESLAARLLKTTAARLIPMLYRDPKPSLHGSVLSYVSKIAVDAKMHGTTETRSTEYSLPVRILVPEATQSSEWSTLQCAQRVTLARM